MPSGPRYAVYFAPDSDTALWRFGSACLGYDAERGEDCDSLPLDGWAADAWRAATEEPRRYGFHATLKAPFYLADGASEAVFLDALDAFAASRAAFAIDGLRVHELSRFVALTPTDDAADLLALAADCVRAFEPFRAPLSPEDLARRLAAPLTDRQKAHLERWGYPYVLEDFRFHMTLTGPLADAPRAAAAQALTRVYADQVGEGPVAIRSIALFRQDSRDARFKIVRRAPLLGTRSVAAPR